jgi:hypothetical protein
VHCIKDVSTRAIKVGNLALVQEHVLSALYFQRAAGMHDDGLEILLNVRVVVDGMELSREVSAVGRGVENVATLA